jgi:hypothetical protein
MGTSGSWSWGEARGLHPTHQWIVFKTKELREKRFVTC